MKYRGASGWRDGCEVTVSNYDGLVRLEVTNLAYPAGLEPEEARYLARKLYRLARQIEEES